jgi:hypothetical protein
MNHEIERMLSLGSHFKNLNASGFNFFGYQLHSILIAYFVTEAVSALDVLPIALHDDPIFKQMPGYSISNLRYDLHFLAMIHDIGKLIVGELFPDVYIALRTSFINIFSTYQTIADQESMLLKAKLNRSKNIDHATISAAILSKLSFHLSFQKAAHEHHRASMNSNPIADFFYLSHALFVRDISRDGNERLIAKIDLEILKLFIEKYNIDEEKVRLVLVEVESRVNTYLAYMKKVDDNEIPKQFVIFDEDKTDLTFREINNKVFESIQLLTEADQIFVIDKMLRQLQQKTKNYYTYMHYLQFDIAGHTMATKSVSPISAERAMSIFHDFIKQLIGKFKSDSLQIVNVVGDCYTLAFPVLENALYFYSMLEKNIDILSMKAAIKFELYYYIHAGQELRCALLTGGEKYSEVLNELGHMAKEIKSPGKIVISEAVLKSLKGEEKKRYKPHEKTSDGILTFQEKR